ncbi:SNF2 family N-terminal domain-containing protein [Cantharellus anzutake]|uniref:SNF2 family N-terminal domain-containing protein n=1 Tax=Cantharellus anzutake TaxID=1750568 RepID=UPI001906CF28|nr:SNF2 family N-terminal domain-containing protein [Cantharellus anzutake]KAF8318839.1 SNF2 family N-terminal domain-containing protein [Cantharellus anzutake]
MSELTEKLEIPEVQEDMEELGEDALGLGDIGVKAWKDKTHAWLCQCLVARLGAFRWALHQISGVHNGMDQRTEEQWEDAYTLLKQGRTLPEGFYVQEAMWHQLVAVAAIVQHFFTRECNPMCSSPEGMAIIDEVGLGKTLEVILSISFLIGLVDGRKAQKADPPILGMAFLHCNQPYLSGHSEVPNWPHLIIVPNTLVPQWKHSLTCWLKPASADVLVYAEGKQARNEFWAPNGPYESSLFKKWLVWIIYTSQDKGLKAGSSKQSPWIPVPSTARPTSSTHIHKHQLLSILVDEAHLYRNNISPLLSIAQSCAMLVALTTTPLFTGHRDLLSISHLLNFKDLCSGAAMDKNKVFSSSIQKAHAAHCKALGDMEDQTSTTETNELRNLVNAQLEPVSWLKGSFKSHLIHCTGESRGEPLIGLCAHKCLVIKITLSPNEMGLIEQAHKDCKGEGRRDGALFDPWAFYSGPRQENMSPGLDKNCGFDLQETWKEKGGTKLKALDQLWSSQDERQVIGHVQWKGQTKKVTVVWLLADGTTDTLLYQFAQGKARQSETFSKAKAFLALNNDEDSDGDTSDSGIDDRSPSIVQAKGKGTSHKRKRSNDVADKGKKQKTKGGFKGKEVAAPPALSPILYCHLQREKSHSL